MVFGERLAIICEKEEEFVQISNQKLHLSSHFLLHHHHRHNYKSSKKNNHSTKKFQSPRENKYNENQKSKHKRRTNSLEDSVYVYCHIFPGSFNNSNHIYSFYETDNFHNNINNNIFVDKKKHLKNKNINNLSSNSTKQKEREKEKEDPEGGQCFKCSSKRCLPFKIFTQIFKNCGSLGKNLSNHNTKQNKNINKKVEKNNNKATIVTSYNPKNNKIVSYLESDSLNRDAHTRENIDKNKYKNKTNKSNQNKKVKRIRMSKTKDNLIDNNYEGCQENESEENINKKINNSKDENFQCQQFNFKCKCCNCSLDLLLSLNNKKSSHVTLQTAPCNKMITRNLKYKNFTRQKSIKSKPICLASTSSFPNNELHKLHLIPNISISELNPTNPTNHFNQASFPNLTYPMSPSLKNQTFNLDKSFSSNDTITSGSDKSNNFYKNFTFPFNPINGKQRQNLDDEDLKEGKANHINQKTNKKASPRLSILKNHKNFQSLAHSDLSSTSDASFTYLSGSDIKTNSNQKNNSDYESSTSTTKFLTLSLSVSSSSFSLNSSTMSSFSYSSTFTSLSPPFSSCSSSPSAPSSSSSKNINNDNDNNDNNNNKNNLIKSNTNDIFTFNEINEKLLQNNDNNEKFDDKKKYFEDSKLKNLPFSIHKKKIYKEENKKEKEKYSKNNKLDGNCDQIKGLRNNDNSLTSPHNHQQQNSNHTSPRCLPPSEHLRNVNMESCGRQKRSLHCLPSSGSSSFEFSSSIEIVFTPCLLSMDDDHREEDEMEKEEKNFCRHMSEDCSGFVEESVTWVTCSCSSRSPHGQPSSDSGSNISFCSRSSSISNQLLNKSLSLSDQLQKKETLNLKLNGEVQNVLQKNKNIKSCKSMPNHLNIDHEKNTSQQMTSLRASQQKDTGNLPTDLFTWNAPISKRTEGKEIQLDEILKNVKNSKKQFMSLDDSQILNRRKVKRTIRSLFNLNAKLHKNFKRGLYIVSIVQQKGRVLATNDDVLPCIEVNCDHLPSSYTLKSEFNWLSKVVCNWSNIKPLKHTLEKPSHVTDSLNFRGKLLQSIYQMQKAVGVDDLGTLHHQLLTDNESNCHIFLFVRSLGDDVKVASALKWCGVSKMMRKRTSCTSSNICLSDPSTPLPPNLNSKNSSTFSSSLNCKSESNLLSQTSESFPQTSEKKEINMMDFITTNIPKWISLNSSCRTKLAPGLYVGYVKLSSFIDQLKILVPSNAYNVFPNVKMRTNFKISREEWEAIEKQLVHQNSVHQTKQTNADHLTLSQKTFMRQIHKASKELMKQLCIQDSDQITSHRLYTNEFFEFSPDVTFILLLPSVKNVCSGLGQEERPPSGFCSIPLQQFEIYHMQTYHQELTRRYSQLSTLLEAEVAVSTHQMRQDLSSHEQSNLKDHVTWIHQQQKRLDEAWKSMRWITEVISNARDCRINYGVPFNITKVD